MNFSRIFFDKTRLLVSGSRPVAQRLKYRKYDQGLRRYASARPVGGSSGGLTNLQIALITGGISYVAAHAVYVYWSDHLASQSHSKSSEGQHEEEVEAASAEEVSSPAEAEVAEVSSVPEPEVAEVASVPEPEVAEVASVPEPEVAEVASVPEPEVAEVSSVPEPEVAEVSSVPEPEVAEVSSPPEVEAKEESKAEEALPVERISEDTSSSEQVQVPESSGVQEEPVPTITEAAPVLSTPEQEVTKDVLVSSNESVTIVAGAPVPRHPVCEESHPPLSLESESKDVIITQEPKANS